MHYGPEFPLVSPHLLPILIPLTQSFFTITSQTCNFHHQEDKEQERHRLRMNIKARSRRRPFVGPQAAVDQEHEAGEVVMGSKEMVEELNRDIAVEIIEALVVIFQESPKSGRIPENLKMANVASLLKNGGREKTINYRMVKKAFSMLAFIAQTIGYRRWYFML
eukprot:g41979.t1